MFKRDLERELIQKDEALVSPTEKIRIDLLSDIPIAKWIKEGTSVCRYKSTRGIIEKSEKKELCLVHVKKDMELSDYYHIWILYEDTTSDYFFVTNNNLAAIRPPIKRRRM